MTQAKQRLDGVLTPFEFDHGLTEGEKRAAADTFSTLVDDVLLSCMDSFTRTQSGESSPIVQESMVFLDPDASNGESKIVIAVAEIQIGTQTKCIDVNTYDGDERMMRHLYKYHGDKVVRLDQNEDARRKDFDDEDDEEANMLLHIRNQQEATRMGFNDQPIGTIEMQKLDELVRSVYGLTT